MGHTDGFAETIRIVFATYGIIALAAAAMTIGIGSLIYARMNRTK